MLGCRSIACSIIALTFFCAAPGSFSKDGGGFEKPKFDRPRIDNGQLEKSKHEKFSTESQVVERSHVNNSVIESPAFDKGKLEKQILEKPIVDQTDTGEVFPHKNLHRKLPVIRNGESNYVKGPPSRGFRGNHFRHHLYRGKADPEVD